MSEKKRLDWVDMVKGYGMLAVVGAHVGFIPFGAWLYSFVIPGYFLISGYLFSPKDSFKTYLWRKIRTLLIPYFCLCFPIVVKAFITHPQNRWEKAFQTALKIVVQKRAWAVWFIPALFAVSILFYFAWKWLKTDARLAVLSCVIIAGATVYFATVAYELPWNFDAAVMAFPFFFGGYYYKSHKEAFDRYFDDKRRSVLLFFLCGAICLGGYFLSYKLVGETLDMYQTTYGILPLSCLSSFAGIAALIILSKWLTIKPIRFVGQNSVLYLCWHKSLFMPLGASILAATHLFDGVDLDTRITGSSLGTSDIAMIMLYRGLQFAIVMACCTLCSWLIPKTKLKFIMGK